MLIFVFNEMNHKYVQNPDGCSFLLAGFWKSVNSGGDDELMIADFLLQETLQLVDIHLGDAGTRSDEHTQHGVDPFQGHAFQIGQHGLNVGPEQLKKKDKQVKSS